MSSWGQLPPLSVDPFIQAPHDTQCYNKYSYVKNNPLNYTDPSGYIWGIGSWVKKNFRTIVAMTVPQLVGNRAKAWIIQPILGD